MTTLSYEVYGETKPLADPVSKRTLPETFGVKFKEVQHKEWPLTMEADDIVNLKGPRRHVKVIIHVRLLLNTDLKPTNARHQFQSFVKDFQVHPHPHARVHVHAHTHARMHARAMWMCAQSEEVLQVATSQLEPLAEGETPEEDTWQVSNLFSW